MKRKLVLVTVFAMSLLTFAACGKKKEDNEPKSVKEDFVEFVGTELPEAEKAEIDIMNAYNSYFEEGKEVDTATLLTDLNNNLIPKYKEFITSVEAIEVETDEVNAIKTKYIDAMKLQGEALENVALALEKEEKDYQTVASEKLNDSKIAYNEYNTAVTQLATENNVSLTGNEE